MSNPHPAPQDLDRLPLVVDLGDSAKQHLGALAQTDRFGPGDVIFREGDPSNNVYLVSQGHVALTMAVERRGESTILTLGPGDLLGWSGLEHGRTRVATARAVESTVLFRLPSEELLELCERDHDIGYAVMKQAFSELAVRLHDTRLQLLDMFRSPTG
jgi:CRP-like cAMP-binding protein